MPSALTSIWALALLMPCCTFKCLPTNSCLKADDWRDILRSLSSMQPLCNHWLDGWQLLGQDEGVLTMRMPEGQAR